MVTFKVGDQSVSEKQASDYFDAVWMESDEYWRTKVKPDWEQNDRLYQEDIVAPADKLDWQSDVRIPVADSLVTRLVNFFNRILVSTNEDYFTVKLPNKDKQQAYKELLKARLRIDEFPNKAFHPAMSRGLLNSVYVNKVCRALKEFSYPDYDGETGKYSVVRETKASTEIEAPSPKNIRLDPIGDRYLIEILPVIPLHEFEEMGKLNGWKNVRKVVESIVTHTDNAKEERPSSENESPYLRTVNLKILHTRALTDDKGGVLVRDVKIYIANNKHVLWVEKNILPGGQFPYVVQNPIASIYGRYGRAYISKIKSLIVSYIEAINLALDGFRLSALGIYEYDTEVMSKDTGHLFTAVLEPGRFYPKAGQGRGINGVFNNSLQSAGALQIVFFLDRELQNKSFQNEFFQGAPTVKGRPTLGEISIKTQESSAFFTDIATHIERNILTPVLYLTLVTDLIYLDDVRGGDLLENISDDAVKGYIRSLTFSERMEDVRNMSIEVTGISGKIKRLSNFNKLIQILSVLGNVPGVMSAVRSDQLVKKLFEITDDTPDEVFDMQMLPALAEQALAQQQAPQQPGGMESMGLPIGG